MPHRLLNACAIAALTLVAAGSHASDDVVPAAGASADAAPATRIQHPLIGSDFPIARAVEVPAGTGLVWHSGTVPSPADPDAERFSAQFWGDTRTQSLSVFAKLEASLTELGLSFDDIVKMTVYLVPDPNNGGRIDFDGFMQAYTQYYGASAQRANLPARSAVGVAQLVAPGMLVEVDAVFARPAR